MSMLTIVGAVLNEGWDDFSTNNYGKFTVVSFYCGVDAAVLVFENSQLKSRWDFDYNDEAFYWDHNRFIVEAVK